MFLPQVSIYSGKEYIGMSDLININDLPLTGLPKAFLPGNIPPEAGIVIGQLLLCSSDERIKALGKRIISTHPLSLDGITDAYEAMLLRLPVNKEQPIKRAPSNPIDYKQIPIDSVEDWFSENGPFRRILPHYERRNEQVEMACRVAAAFNGAEHFVVEAGTGIGKTMAYLVPAVLWSMTNSLPVIVSTNTKNLQTQIFEKDLPVIKEALYKNLRYSVIKGRSNYVCLSRIAEVLSNVDVEVAEEQIYDLAKVCAWLFQTVDGDLSKAPPVTYCDNGANKLFSSPEECRGRKCPYYSRCFLQTARVKSQNSDIVITNHSVYFSEPSDHPLALPVHAHVIFDEAHNLEEAATRKFVREITPLGFMLPMRRMYYKTPKGEHGLIVRLKHLLLSSMVVPETTAQYRDTLFSKLNDLTDLFGKLRVVIPPYLRQLEKLIPQHESSLRILPNMKSLPSWQDAEPLLNKVLDTLYAITTSISDIADSVSSEVEQSKKSLEDPLNTSSPLLPLLNQNSASFDAVCQQFISLADEFTQYSSTFGNLLADIEFITSVDDKNWVYWIERAGIKTGRSFAVTLHAAPISIARFLAEELYSRKDSIIFCSATMNVAGSTEFISHRIGMDLVEQDRISSFVAGSAFNFKEQCRVLVPSFLPDPSDKNGEEVFAKAFAECMKRVLVLTNGRTLILFTSYKLMMLCAEQLEAELLAQAIPIHVLVQGVGASRESLTEQFKQKDRASVLLGTDSFWEGVDLIGDALTNLVIVKLPFDAVNDPIVNARAERVRMEMGDSFMGYTVPNAVIKFRQGFGRLIRHKQDRGIVIITDPRLISKNYGAVFRKSIPTLVERVPTENELNRIIEAFFAASTI
jgi:ATP-dependent DNA helicase DinG